MTLFLSLHKRFHQCTVIQFHSFARNRQRRITETPVFGTQYHRMAVVRLSFLYFVHTLEKLRRVETDPRRHGRAWLRQLFQNADYSCMIRVNFLFHPFGVLVTPCSLSTSLATSIKKYFSDFFCFFQSSYPDFTIMSMKIFTVSVS